jgi:chromatin remodeling complex protein RSC6
MHANIIENSEEDYLPKRINKNEKKYAEFAGLKFITSLSDMKCKISEQSKMLKEMKNDIKKLEDNYYHDLNTVLKQKSKRTGNYKPVGFVKKIPWPKELAELINKEEGCVYSTPEYTKELYKILKQENLLYENDNRIFRANDKFIQVFNLDKYVNESTNFKDSNGFNFSTLQSHISKAYKKYNIQIIHNEENILSL